MTSRRASSSSSEKMSRRSSRAGLHTPILGKGFKIPELYRELPPIELDDTMSYVSSSNCGLKNESQFVAFCFSTVAKAYLSEFIKASLLKKIKIKFSSL